MTIAVLGDAFIDKYHIGTSNRLSAEVPIPVVNITETFNIDGGALNVRANLRALGVDGLYLFKSNQTYPIKNRLVVDNHQLARWDENDYTTPYTLDDLKALPRLDALIVADYGKGAIQPNLINAIAANVQETGLQVFVDTKQDPMPWLDVLDVVMFPNLKEYNQFKTKYEWFPDVVLKQGPLGISLVNFGKVVLTSPSKATNIVSVNGAGDTVIAAFSVAMQSGADVGYCLDYANAAAAVVCEKPYTSVASQTEIDKLLLS